MSGTLYGQACYRCHVSREWKRERKRGVMGRLEKINVTPVGSRVKTLHIEEQHKGIKGKKELYFCYIRDMIDISL